MKKFLVVALFTVYLTGCDFIRVIASRPTSSQLAEKKAAIEGRAAAVDTCQKDTCSVQDVLEQPVAEPVRLMKYYVSVGTFFIPENADKIERMAISAGHSVVRIPYRGGIMIALDGTDDKSEAYASLAVIRKESFCPPDAWVLVNE